MASVLNFFDSIRRADAEYEKKRKKEGSKTLELTRSYQAATDKLKEIRDNRKAINESNESNEATSDEDSQRSQESE